MNADAAKKIADEVNADQEKMLNQASANLAKRILDAITVQAKLGEYKLEISLSSYFLDSQLSLKYLIKDFKLKALRLALEVIENKYDYSVSKNILMSSVDNEEYIIRWN